MPKDRMCPCFYGYIAPVEISHASAAFSPGLCAIIRRGEAGESLGPCLCTLKNGTTCPVHGKVKKAAK